MSEDEIDEAASDAGAAFLSKLGLDPEQIPPVVIAGLKLYGREAKKYRGLENAAEISVGVLGVALVMAEAERRRRGSRDGESGAAPRGPA